MRTLTTLLIFLIYLKLVREIYNKGSRDAIKPNKIRSDGDCLSANNK